MNAVLDVLKKVTIVTEPWHFSRARADSDETHLRRTMDWLARAQDAVKGAGVSIHYDRHRGWHPDPYPETAGYILATFLKYAQLTGDRGFIDRAVLLGDWEIKIQHPSGGVLSSVHKDITRVFNTGQVILGWCCLFEETRDEKFLNAALRAGDYLIRTQEPDGSWIKDTHCGARTYHARTSWGLLRLASLSGQEKYFAAGYKNILWVLAQQKKNGWFKNCGFYSHHPITHVIGYTLRGILECGQLMVKHTWPGRTGELLAAAGLTGQALHQCAHQCRIARIPGMLPAAFDDRWQSRAFYSCLTGNAQIAVCLTRLAQITRQEEYLKSASVLIDTLKRTQNYQGKDAREAGGIAGSFPFYGSYESGQFPNWAAKFFADSLIMRIKQKDQWWIQA